LCDIGCRDEAIEMTGNMKFDGASSNPDHKLDVSALLRRLGAVKDAPVLVGGSTHDGEERLLAQMFPRLKEHCPGLMLVLVPRHFERARVVGEQLRALGQRFVFRSELTDESGADCLVVDSTGELMLFYEAASVVFVGKSLTAHGGQNPIEPAALGRAIVFGPNMQNFRAVVGSFLEEDAATQVADADELEIAVAELLKNPGKRNAQGTRARAVVEANKGAAHRTAQMCARVLSQLSVDTNR
jgi:3-deoxy-D-manno-octulosonic-acid transferase